MPGQYVADQLRRERRCQDTYSTPLYIYAPPHCDDIGQGSHQVYNPQPYQIQRQFNIPNRCTLRSQLIRGTVQYGGRVEHVEARRGRYSAVCACDHGMGSSLYAETYFQVQSLLQTSSYAYRPSLSSSESSRFLAGSAGCRMKDVSVIASAVTAYWSKTLGMMNKRRDYSSSEWHGPLVKFFSKFPNSLHIPVASRGLWNRDQSSTASTRNGVTLTSKVHQFQMFSDLSLYVPPHKMTINRSALQLWSLSVRGSTARRVKRSGSSRSISQVGDVSLSETALLSLLFCAQIPSYHVCILYGI